MRTSNKFRIYILKDGKRLFAGTAKTRENAEKYAKQGMKAARAEAYEIEELFDGEGQAKMKNQEISILTDEFVASRNFTQPLDLMVDAYIECALWSSEPDPKTDEWSSATLSDEAKATMRSDCRVFLRVNWDDIKDEPCQAGHDFWLTRNGHGAGFWDGDWPKDVGERLTKYCRTMGESDLYVGDDGQIHVS